MDVEETDKDHHPMVSVDDTDVNMETTVPKEDDAAAKVDLAPLDNGAGTPTSGAASNSGTRTAEEETYLLDDDVSGSKKVEAKAQQGSEREGEKTENVADSSNKKHQKGNESPSDVDSTVKRTQDTTKAILKNIGDLSDANEGCSKCKETFDTDTSLIESAGPHRLPFTCSKCFFYTICGVCFESVDWASFQCPICRNQQGFDKDEQVPNLLLCSLLRKQQELNVMPATSVTPDADSKCGDGPDKDVQDPTVGQAPAATKRPTKASRKKIQAVKHPVYNVGDRVYCKWPKTKTYFWGEIATKTERPNGTTTYKVQFDDGDVLEEADWMDFLTEKEFKKAGGKVRATKDTTSKQSQSLTAKRKTPADEVKSDRKTTAASKLRRKSSDSSVSAASRNIEVWSGTPSEELEGGWPEGWTKKIFERTGGKSTGHSDPYWYTPIEKKRLRSMNEVRRFLAALEKCEGDEGKAWEVFKR